MNRFHRGRLGLLALAGVVAVALAGTASAKDKETIIIEKQQPAAPVMYHYVYYPSAEVYFAPDTHEYWVRKGSRWHAVTEVPSGVTLGRSVPLDVDKPEPWTSHETIVEKYGGKHTSKETIREKTTEKDGDDVKTKEKIREKEESSD